MIDRLRWSRAALDARRGELVRLANITVEVPGTRRERLSVVAETSTSIAFSTAG
jgi:hypothetical protein